MMNIYKAEWKLWQKINNY